MADKDTWLRGIDYRATFPFIHLFRSFRLAIDPSKLALALAAILLLYVGGRLMDSMWPSKYRAIPTIEFRSGSLGDRATPAGAALTGEIVEYEKYLAQPTELRQRLTFSEIRTKAAEARVEGVKEELRGKNITEGELTVSRLKQELDTERQKAIDEIKKAFDALPEEERKKEEAQELRDERIQTVWRDYAQQVKRVERYQGEGLFIHFINYQINRVDDLAGAAVELDSDAVFVALTRFFIVAPRWAVTQHPVFFSIFFILYILLMAITGGAISRIAAVQVARDEKISIRQALRFSTGKVLSFIFAPLIPIIIIVAIMLVLAICSLLMSVPYLGGFWSILVGALFFLALLAGLVMTLTALGLVGGGHLMYPTIAVEGSDSFDAVSRSFSYLYARPWQLIFYSVVALVYGAITYLFVRFFLYLLLVLTHVGVGLFMWSTAPSGAPTLDVMWQPPMSPLSLTPDANFALLDFWAYDVGSWLMLLWVYITIGLLGAFAISLYFSSSTIIYYLMRREVDATAIDEVYLEPSDDEFADTTPEPVNSAPASTPPAAASEPTTSPEAPAESSQADASQPEAPKPDDAKPQDQNPDENRSA